PGVSLRVEPLTEKDLTDLDFGLQQDVDYVAMSFVRRGDDIRKLRALIEDRGKSVRIVAKIEMQEAVEDLEEICRLSDAIMVARGDLAVEVRQEKLPGIQKRIIKMCNELGKPVITATQMLESMIEDPTPTRAEITDVANAVWDGTDAVMLSAETANGKYPLKCLQTMHRIICEVETQLQYHRISIEKDYLSTPAALAASATLSALKLGASTIVCLTTTGRTAQLISSFRPQAQIVAVTDQMSVLNRLELLWGVSTFPIPNPRNLEAVISEVQRLLLEYGLAKLGDKVVMTLGLPVESGAKTNSLHVFHLDAEGIPRLENSVLPLRCRA
ncbi:MAG: pyruvate kinase, partial [Bdellovibrio sp.]